MANFIEKALRILFPESKRLEIFSAYGDRESCGDFLSGFEQVKETRAKGESVGPVLICGFESEEHIRQNERGSILDAPGVLYLRLPARLSDIEPIIERAANAEILTEEVIDEKSFRDYAVKKIRAFKHRLDNVCTSMEMNANRARKELETSPRILPKALLELKPTIVQNLLSEYKELNGLVMRLNITNAVKVPGMIDAFLSASQEIENQTSGPSNALDLAFRIVELGRAISSILEQAKEL